MRMRDLARAQPRTMPISAEATAPARERNPFPGGLDRPVRRLQNVTAHNARHRRAQDFRRLFTSVPKRVSARHAKSAMFSGDFGNGDGLKTRRLRQCKMWIRQVLISRTLTDCGEVAERLKAAVC